MTAKIYTSNTEIERARSLWEKGVLLAERRDGFHTLKLYQLYDIYIEVVWHTHFNVTLQVTTFTDTDRLDPYLEGISLENVYDA